MPLINLKVPMKASSRWRFLRRNLGWMKSSASRRAKDAIKRGYLNNLEDKRGRPARLVLGDPLPDDVEVLPTPENLKAKYCTLAASTVGRRLALLPLRSARRGGSVDVLALLRRAQEGWTSRRACGR